MCFIGFGIILIFMIIFYFKNRFISQNISLTPPQPNSIKSHPQKNNQTQSHQYLPSPITLQSLQSSLLPFHPFPSHPLLSIPYLPFLPPHLHTSLTPYLFFLPRLNWLFFQEKNLILFWELLLVEARSRPW